MRLLLAGAIVMGATVLSSQVPVRPQRPVPGDNAPVGPAAEITGQVVDTDGRAIPTVAVRLVGERSVRTTLTDQRGRFELKNVLPGEYVVTARKFGFYDGAYGKKRAGGDPLPVALAAGQAIADMRIELFRAGVITGIVSDEAAEPVIGARVVAMRRVFVEGEWQYVAAGSDITDDNGFYRVFGLEPGEYVISTPTVQTGADVPGDRMLTQELPHTEGVRQAYPTLFWPASRYFILAQAVHLSSGEVRYGVNFQWSPVAARAISGRLVGAGAVVADQVIKLVPLDTREVGLGNEAAVAISGPDGAFAFERVPAGEYRLEAGGAFRQPGLINVPAGDAAPKPEAYWGRAVVNVTDEDIRGLVVQMRTGYALHGTIVAPRATADVGPFAADRVSISIVSARPGLSEARTPQVLAGGTFESTNLIPGQYYVRVGRLPFGWYVTGLTQDGRNLLDEPADLGDGDAAVVVTVTDRPALISGAVRDNRLQAASGATIIVIPASVDHWSPNRTRRTRTSTNGQYAIAGLPPGDYLIVAVDDAVSEGWQDGAMLSQLRTLATRVSLRDQEQRTLHLRMSTVRR